jgi:hypothetical protein
MKGRSMMKGMRGQAPAVIRRNRIDIMETVQAHRVRNRCKPSSRIAAPFIRLQKCDPASHANLVRSTGPEQDGAIVPVSVKRPIPDRAPRGTR